MVLLLPNGIVIAKTDVRINKLIVLKQIAEVSDNWDGLHKRRVRNSNESIMIAPHM